jgi:hypothetical protein
MAQITMRIMDRLNVLMKNAFKEAVRCRLPDTFLTEDLSGEFALSVHRRFQMWENVPDRLLEGPHGA